MAYKMNGFGGFGNSPVKLNLTKEKKRKAEMDEFFEEDKELSPAEIIGQKQDLEKEKKHGGNIPVTGFSPGNYGI